MALSKDVLRAVGATSGFALFSHQVSTCPNECRRSPSPPSEPPPLSSPCPIPGHGSDVASGGHVGGPQGPIGQRALVLSPEPVQPHDSPRHGKCSHDLPWRGVLVTCSESSLHPFVVAVPAVLALWSVLQPRAPLCLPLKVVRGLPSTKVSALLGRARFQGSVKYQLGQTTGSLDLTQVAPPQRERARWKWSTSLLLSLQRVRIISFGLHTCPLSAGSG